MNRSLRVRLLVWLAALLLPVLLCAAVVLVQTFSHRLMRDLDVALEEEADTVAVALAAPTAPQAIADLLSRIAGETDLGTPKYVTVTQRDRLLGEAPAGAHQAMLSDATLRIARSTYASRDGLVVSVAVSGTLAAKATRRLASLLGIGIPLLLLTVGGGIWFIVGHTLGPLESAARQMQAIGLDNLSVRIDAAGSHDEVGHMVGVLNQMLDRLERAVAELRRFTTDAAHELRTPLTILRTGLDIALVRERPALEYRAALGEALTATERMQHLADDLLTLSRIEGAGPLPPAAAVDVEELLRDLADAWTATAAQRGVTIAIAAAAPCSMIGHSAALYRLFNNLIDNALRHTPDGGRIDLGACSTTAQVVVTVADTGPGIASDDLPHVFQRFYRGSSALAGGGGSGLGLSIAREIARAHQGHLEIANRAAQGCIATVTLPCSPPPARPI